MLNIHLICVGKLKEKFYLDACAEYRKRLSSLCRLTVVELPEERLPANPSQAQIDAALKKEAAAIRDRLPPNAALVALCVEGRPYSSEELAGLLRAREETGAKPVALIIGSSYGLDRELKAQARVRLSISPMTFPHHLVRVIVLEQLYRAFQINLGSPYHK